MLGVTECTVTNWEKYRTTPVLWTLPKIIEFLGNSSTDGDEETLGGKILRYRKYRGLTQKELARQIGIDPTTLGRLENNRARCLKSVIRKLAVSLRNCSLQDERASG